MPRSAPASALATMGIEDLRRKLASSPRIDQAKGVLSGYLGISPETGFEVLRRWSSQHNRPVRELSALIVTAATEGPSNREALRRLFEELERKPPQQG